MLLHSVLCLRHPFSQNHFPVYHSKKNGLEFYKQPLSSLLVPSLFLETTPETHYSALALCTVLPQSRKNSPMRSTLTRSVDRVCTVIYDTIGAVYERSDIPSQQSIKDLGVSLSFETSSGKCSFSPAQSLHCTPWVGPR